MSLQSHIISGFVGGDPESREVHIEGREEQSVTTMSVAVNNPRKPNADPTWYRVSMWNGLGKVVEQYVQKGSYVVVSGSRLAVSVWTDKV